MNITDFEIRNFRVFESLSLAGLQRVNLISGENNVGKSALLEALWQFSGPDQPDIGVRLNQFRGNNHINPGELLSDLFYRYDIAREIELSATGEWGPNRRTLRITSRERDATPIALRSPNERGELPLPLVESSHEIVLCYTDGEDEYLSRGWFVRQEAGPGVVDRFEKRTKPVMGHPSAHYFSPRHRNPPQEDAERYGRLEVTGSENGVVEALRVFEPRLRRLATISIDRTPVIHADVGLGRLIPTGLLGDGIQRVLSLALAFGVASGGLVLIDEVENGIHHSRLGELWRAISAFSERFDVQVFATTHSQECVRAAHMVFSQMDDYQLSFLRLDRVNGQVKSKAFDRTTLGTALDANLEVR